MSVLELFCAVDDFWLAFAPHWKASQLATEKQRLRAGQLCPSEIITILIHFHQSHYRTFKAYYTEHVQVHLRSEFPRLISSQCFVTLIASVQVPMLAYLQSRYGSCTGISFIDSTSLEVCDPKRISSHRVFATDARRGKSSMGWFFGFKLHLAVNDQGEARQSFIDPGDMIASINLILKGWMNYYCYASNPHRVFARVLHHAFWCLVRYLNKRRKQKGAKKVMRQYYGKVKGKKTLKYTSPLTGQQVSLVRSIGRKSIYQLKCDQIDADTRKHPWMNYSASVGRSPWQRKEVQTLQQGQCAQCGAPITEVHHRSTLSQKANAGLSGYATTKMGLCHTCHVTRTRQQRQNKSQQGKLSTPKGVRSV